MMMDMGTMSSNKEAGCSNLNPLILDQGEPRVYPFIYGAEDRLDLVRLVERHYSDPDHQLDHWVRQFLREGGSTNTLALLVNLNRTIRNTFIHVAVRRSPAELRTSPQKRDVSGCERARCAP
jgi:hypothetical protein